MAIDFHQMIECPKLRWSQIGHVYKNIETKDVFRVVQVIPHFKEIVVFL